MATKTKPQSALTSDVTADAIESAPWLHGSIKLKVNCDQLVTVLEGSDKVAKDQACKRILRAFEKRVEDKTDPEVYNIDLDDGYVMIELVFSSKTTATDFITGHFESCKPKRALKTYLTMSVESCDILKDGREIKPTMGVDSAVTLVGKGVIPSSKGTELTELLEKMENMTLKPSPSVVEKLRDYEILDERKINDMHKLEFSKLVGGTKWKEVARHLHELGCKALHEAEIDNIDHDNHRNVKEQAYQMIRKYCDSEGSKATLGRLVKAMDRSGCTEQANTLIAL